MPIDSTDPENYVELHGRVSIFGAVYDSGDYAVALDRALAAAGYEDLRAEQAKRRADRDVAQLGIGLSCYVEITGAGASPAADGRSTGGLRELTADFGARWHEIEDDDPARALVSFAHGPRRPDEADRHDLVFIGPGRLGYTWGPVGAMLAGLVT